MSEKIIKRIFHINKSELDYFSIIILGMAFIIGIAVRINFIINSDFPINDGGFFYQMVEDLIANGYRLPEFTVYNKADIPYAYPPLAFYIVGVLHTIFNVQLIALFHYFPLIISILVIPVYFLFTKIFFDNLRSRSIATYLFVTLPRSFEWFVMGGGVTRSLGLLFAILSIYFTWWVFVDKKININLIWSIIFSVLTILSHPVASLFLVFSILAFTIYHKLDLISIKKCIILITSVLLLTSPWWVTIIKSHGLSPFIGAGNSGNLVWVEIMYLITQNYGYENPYFLPIVSLFALIGAFNKNSQRSLLLIVLLVGGYLVIPRGGVDLLTTYLAILGAIGLIEVINIWDPNQSYANLNKDNGKIPSKRARSLIFLVLIYTLLGAFTYKHIDGKADLHLSSGDVKAMEWLNNNTASSAKILLLPSQEENRYWWNDFKAEWLPTIAKRESVTTVQGYEWLPEIFPRRIEEYTALRFCVTQSPSCVIDWQREFEIGFDYIYIGDLEKKNEIIEDYIVNNLFSIVYQNDEVILMQTNQ